MPTLRPGPGGNRSANLLNAVTTVQTGTPIESAAGRKVVRAKLAGTGALTANVNIYGSTDNAITNGILLATLSPSGTTTAADGVAFDAPWPFMWADLTAITGTGCACTVDVGV